MAPNTPSKRLLIFCDGTWCGRETATESNIYCLANRVGKIQFSCQPGEEPTKVHPIQPFQNNIVAGSQEGVGLNKTFLEYLWDGATASTIGEECISVYKFIVDHYTSEHEIWMFGFSRGAFTVRCVAGIINNCGIIKKQPDLSDEDILTLCAEVYRTYRSPLDIDHPRSDKCVKQRSDSSRVWPSKRPVRLMVVVDTVGGLGIPRLNSGIGFDWPEFYDQKVSTVVQEMYHAPALHDRLWIFQPCLAFNGPGEEEVKIHQTWFPGCHYDVGRQRFRFLRQAPSNKIEKALGALPARLSETVHPNQVLSDVVLRWMLEAIVATEKRDGRIESMVPDIEKAIQELSASIATPVWARARDKSSGDVYGNVLDYAPAGSLFAPLLKFGSTAVSFLNKAFPKLGDNIQDLLGIKVLLRILTATSDRRVPGDAAVVYPYKEEEVGRFRGEETRFTVYEQANMGGNQRCGGEKRYPSRTYESFQLWRKAFGA